MSTRNFIPQQIWPVGQTRNHWGYLSDTQSAWKPYQVKQWDHLPLGDELQHFTYEKRPEFRNGRENKTSYVLVSRRGEEAVSILCFERFPQAFISELNALRVESFPFSCSPNVCPSSYSNFLPYCHNICYSFLNWTTRTCGRVRSSLSSDSLLPSISLDTLLTRQIPQSSSQCPGSRMPKTTTLVQGTSMRLNITRRNWQAID